MKKLFVCLGVAVALLVGCDGGSNGALNGPQGGFSYATVDDLPNCSGTREGEVALVESDSTANLCTGGIWHNIGASVATEDALQNCSPNREGKKIYVVESARSLFCTDGRWVEYGPGISSNNGVASSSSYAIASSSSFFYYVLPSFNIASSSSYTIAGSSSANEPSSSIVYGTLTDTRDGQTYKTVTIGDQVWMAENLNYNYNEGTAKSYCYNDNADCDRYGRLYLWSAAMDSAGVFSTRGKGCGDGETCWISGPVRGACPEGWHLPSSDEWEKLGEPYYDSGLRLRSSVGWEVGRDSNFVDFNGNGTDDYGFSALPAGARSSDGSFSGVGYYTGFWTSTENRQFADYASGFDLNYNDNRLGRSGDYKSSARSVRCVQNSSRSNVSYGSLTDSRDGQTYKTVTIGSQTWMAENLRYKTSDGACYNGVSSNCNTYGVLYPNATAMNVCPTGWHLPSSSEWQTLFSAAGSAGNLLADGTNSTEFSAILAGSSNGNFGTYAIFWTSQSGGYSARIDTYSKGVYLAASGEKINVRCVHD